MATLQDKDLEPPDPEHVPWIDVVLGVVVGAGLLLIAALIIRLAVQAITGN